jgi:site-specific DNA recombinase
MLRTAYYARYSCDKQSPTSIDDQIRRCQDLALRHGLTTENVLVFADDALSASGKDDTKRKEFQRLLAAWENNQFDVLLVDEWSRLTREGIEHAKMVKRLEDNRRIRLITGNGLDTNLPNWQLIAGLFGMVGQQSTRDTQFRVVRGMVGQLERGYMIGSPPFGYDIKITHDDAGRAIGTLWVVNDGLAKIVREIYERREQGQSMHQIARWLNLENIPTSRQSRKNGGGYWRPARIRGLMMNPIYRGEFEWHGSNTYQAKAKTKGLDIKIDAYPRPALRLVSDETWSRCNTRSGISRSGYGGGKHALAGLVTCGYCDGILAIAGGKRTPSLCCPRCSIAKMADGQTDGVTVTVATVGAEYLLKEALRYFLTPAFVSAFRESLRLRLSGDTRHEIEETTAELAMFRRKQERLSRMLANGDDDDPVLTERYGESRNAVRSAEERLSKLNAGSVKVDVDAIEAQLNVDPAELLECVFKDTEVAPEYLRALFTRLFPSIVLEGKAGRYLSFFRIQFATGAALSLATETAKVDEGVNELRFALRYTPDNRSGRTQRWSVEPIVPALTSYCSPTLSNERAAARL